MMTYQSMSIMECFVKLDKLALNEVLRVHNIDYKLLQKDYNLLDSEEAVDTSDEDTGNDVQECDQWSEFSPQTPLTRGQKRKKAKRNGFNVIQFNGRKKRQKTANNCPKIVLKLNNLEKRPQNVNNFSVNNKNKSNKTVKTSQTPISASNNPYLSEFESHVSKTKSKSTTKSNPLNAVLTKHFSQSQQPVSRQTSVPFSVSNGQSSTKRPKVAKCRSHADNHCSHFLGEQILTNDLYDGYCECENDCKLDELSIAFHLLTTCAELQLPNDLMIGIDSPYAQLNNTLEDIDPNFEDLLPDLPDVDDIYQLSKEDDFLNSGINDFLMNTSVSQPSVPTMDAFVVNETAAAQESIAPAFDPLGELLNDLPLI